MEKIREMAIYRPQEWRYGQAIFNYAIISHKKEVNELRATEYDCFYDDNKVEIFLEKLNEKLENI